MKNVFLILVALVTVLLAQDAVIEGVVKDKGNGEPLLGVNVYLEGTVLGAATDENGYFVITNVKPGSYTLKAMMVGYKEFHQDHLTVKSGDRIRLIIGLTEEILEGQEIVVQGKKVQNTRASLLRERMSESGLISTLSAEEISGSGGGTVADVAKYITGASLVDGKYVYIRGLGERYMGAMLNGIQLPSTDPDKKTFQMDLIPGSLLDNIKTQKTFTADQPGEFAGGMVDMNLKDYPDRFMMKLQMKNSYQQGLSLNDQFLTFEGMPLNWTGFGTRKLDSFLGFLQGDMYYAFPSYSSARRNEEKALELDRIAKAFDPVMAPTPKKAGLNNDFQWNLGNKTLLFGKELGYFFSLIHGTAFFGYQDGLVGRWRLFGNIYEDTELKNDYYLNDQKNVQSVSWSGMGRMVYRFSPHSRILIHLMHNQDAEAEARYIKGSLPRDLSEGEVFETRVLKYLERGMTTIQLGIHQDIPSLNNSRIELTYAKTEISQDEPDHRYFSDNYTDVQSGDSTVRIYQIKNSVYPFPTRYFRYLDERMKVYKLDFTLPVINDEWIIRSGIYFSQKSRDARELRFEIRPGSVPFTGNPNTFVAPENSGILSVDTVNGKTIYNIGTYITNFTTPRNNYTGNENIFAYYYRMDIPLGRWIKLVGGVRYESTLMKTVTQDSTIPEGKIDGLDVLPAITVNIRPSQFSKISMSYGKTIARPNFREISPYSSFEFVNDFIVTGNPQLERTLIHNYDLRYDFLNYSSDILAIGIFFKNFINPIERMIITDNGEVSFTNVPKARVQGMELEFEKNLAFVGKWLAYISVGGNFSIIQSVVKIPQSEMIQIRALDPRARDTRPLVGQSPYIINFHLNYDNQHNMGWNIYYNRFGKRLYSVTFGATPDIYEQPFEELNISFRKKIGKNVELGMTCKNLFNSKKEFSHEFRGKKYISRSYRPGRVISAAIKYQF